MQNSGLLHNGLSSEARFGIKMSTTDMKLTIAFCSIALVLGFGACSSIQTAPKEVIFTPCCATHAPDKTVTLIGSYESGGTVVRLVH